MKLFFRKTGHGLPLVLLHGLYGSSDNWMSIAGRLAGRYTVYSVDLRNHGHSPHDQNHTYDAMREDLAEFFETHQLDAAVILGHSMGGKAALWFAADFPERVKKLIIVDIAPVNYLEYGSDNQYLQHRDILLAMLGIDFSRVTTRAQVDDALAERIGDQRTVQFLQKNLVADRLTRRLSWRLNVRALYENLDEIVEGVNRRWLDYRIPMTIYPVDFVRGLNSPYVKNEFIPLIREIYPEARIIDIPGASHWVHAEQPELFLEAIMRCC